jgi:HlyD family secretion protein
VQVFSRVSDDTWMGTVTAINTSESSQNNGDMWNNYGVVDSMTLSSSYVFDVELDNVDGLLLGQHVYIELYLEQMPMEGVWIPESFIMDLGMNEETFEMTGAVWAENASGKLERRAVTLGMYDGMTGCYEILSGITAEDYLADPANPGSTAGAAVSRRVPEDFTAGAVEEELPDESMPVETEIMDELVVETGGLYDTALPMETAPEGTVAEG